MKIFQKVVILFLVGILAACTGAAATPELIVETPAPPTATALQPVTPTPTIEVTATPSPTPALDYPVEGYGPSDFPADVNPLTGLEVDDATILERRPVIVKVQNLPRADRPQWGLSAADIVYEYYTELGTTRFAAVYYGENVTQVAPIRSARLFDMNLIRGYKAMFIFGSAYADTYYKLVNSEFSRRLMLESTNTTGVIFRFDPNSKNYEMADLTKVNDYTTKMGIDNTRQELNGMLFKAQTPEGGLDAEQVFVRFSGAIYNRWDYDPAGQNYQRFSDVDNASSSSAETYKQLIDRGNDEPITADNVVIITVRHTDIDARASTEVLDVSLLGTGKAYVMRDGKLYEVTWSRPSETSILTFMNADGSPFALRPGQTWVEVLALNSTMAKQDDGSYRFTFVSDW
ncbi:MAG: hypothetical protein CVU39_21265 [Chloroflexi bacterium HGW-Chloroflexi-10]|nr:MAG: hypothetical protein CVU39_21265 [Chloroflexi bacterium HGW-Chloroflexi-10]